MESYRDWQQLPTLTSLEFVAAALHFALTCLSAKSRNAAQSWRFIECLPSRMKKPSGLASNLPTSGIFFAPKPLDPTKRYTGSAASSSSNWPVGLAQVSSTAFDSSTGLGAHIAIRQCWSNGKRSGSSLNSLKRALNQCGKVVLMRLTDSAFFSPRRRLGALPPQPA